MPEANVTPLLEFNVKVAVVFKIPPLLNTKWPLVTEPCADPKPLSALILIDPALSVVDPE